MGSSSSLKELNAKLDKVSQITDGRTLTKIAETVGKRAKPIVNGAVEPNTLSHWGRGPRRGGFQVQAKYKLVDVGSVALVPTIPPLAALLESGSGDTWKAPRRRGAKRRKKGSVGTYTRKPVPARHAWSKAVPPVRAKAPAIVAEEVSDALRRIF